MTALRFLEGEESPLKADPSRTNRRFDLVTAGHRFLGDALPLRRPESQHALSRFTTVARQVGGSQCDIDSVLTAILSVLDRHLKTIPGLVDRYWMSVDMFSRRDAITRFAACVDDLLKYHAVTDPLVQKAIGVIHRSFCDCKLTSASIAQQLRRDVCHLTVAFKRSMELTIGEYIRQVRLEHAARLLLSTDRSVKQIWSEVGYNHAANFNHDFKRVFRVTPGTYRGSAVQSWAFDKYATEQRGIRESADGAAHLGHVLIVDDDEGVRFSISRYLSLGAYAVATASTAADCMREVDRSVPNVILLDYRLPDLDGLECLRLLRRRGASTRVPIALFTADLELYDHEDEIRALNAIVASKLCALDDVEALVEYLIRTTFGETT